jgi:RNA polymerase sigma-70 factor (ECF subfamily)|tara:strand:+ start:1216 stop:1884 length:669 start_codon:yes stop_codon:yes gene_type:complete
MITDYEQSTDEDLCRMHVDGDDLAFEQLYKKHLKYCMNYVMSKNVGYLDAEECVQKAFSKSVVKIKDLRDFKYFKTWITRNCWNAYLDMYRSRSYRKIESIFSTEGNNGDKTSNLIKPVVELTEKSPNPCETLCQGNEIETKLNLTNKVFKKLDAKSREILETCVVKENSYEETAKILNIPQGTVMSRMHYSRKKFVDIYNRELKKEKAKEADLLILKLNAS